MEVQFEDMMPLRLSKIEKISKPTKKNNVILSMENGEEVVGSADVCATFSEGDILRYSILKKKFIYEDGKEKVVSFLESPVVQDGFLRGKNLLWFDIKTAPIVSQEEFSENPVVKEHWKAKSEETTAKKIEKDYADKAGLYPAYSRVICISYGYYDKENGFTIRSITNEYEDEILAEFYYLLEGPFKYHKLAGHLITYYDINFLYSRYLANKYPPPEKLTFVGKKPWDIEGQIVDLDTLFKNGSRYSESLHSIAYAFGIIYGEIDDKGVLTQKYFKEGKITKVVELCERDVEVAHNIYQEISPHISA